MQHTPHTGTRTHAYAVNAHTDTHRHTNEMNKTDRMTDTQTDTHAGTNTDPRRAGHVGRATSNDPD